MARFIDAFWGEVLTYARLLCAALVIVFGLPAHAQTTVTFENGTINLSLARFAEDTGTRQRVNQTNKLRMLSQKVAADACFVQSGVATHETAPALRATVAQVDAITHALEFGDASIGVFGAEERRKTLAAISQFNALWAPMKATALAVSQGAGSNDDVATLNMQSAELLDVAHMLVTTIATQYINRAEMRQADALVIDIAGRQQFLAQEMSKNACLASTGVTTEDTIGQLQSARAAFDSSLGALTAGMPSLGIQAPPTDKIDAGLTSVRSIWMDMQQPIDAQLTGDTLDDQQLIAVFHGANDVTTRMNNVVGLYAAAARFDS